MLNVLLLQAQPEGNPYSFFIMMGLIIAVFYFFMIRPQSKRQKEQTSFQDSLEKGEEVVTASGIIGKINKMEGNAVTLEVGPKTYIRVTRNAISKDMTESFFAPPAEKK